jgi:hypothetical protein
MHISHDHWAVSVCRLTAKREQFRSAIFSRANSGSQRLNATAEVAAPRRRKQRVKFTLPRSKIGTFSVPCRQGNGKFETDVAALFFRLTHAKSTFDTVHANVR